MDKRTFITELEKSLSVLQEKELKDIIGEYEQHIDMKVERGLTEEEAIADFGGLAELSAEILEAYHVRADYASGSGTKKEKKFTFAESEKAGKEILQQTGEACVKTGKSTMRGLKRVGAWMWGVVMFWKAQLVRPFTWAGRRWAAYRSGKTDAKMFANVQQPEAGMDGENSALHNPIRQKKAGKSVAGGTCRLGNGVRRVCSFFAEIMVGLCRFCWKVFCWCVRVAWNLCWAGFAAFCGIMGIFCLFGLGMLLTLLTQGYPLVGVTIGSLGLNLCLFTAAGFGMTLIRKAKKNTKVLEETPAECQKYVECQEYQECQVQEVQEHA